MHDSEPLCMMNPLLLEYPKRYILGADKAASRLFAQMCTLLIEVDGFICDEYEGAFLWNKPVLSLKDVCSDDQSILVSERMFLESSKMKCNVCFKPVVLNPAFGQAKAVIYGAGNIGIQVLHFLRTKNVQVICFVDSDKAKQGNTIEGLPVHDISLLKELPSNVYVIEAGKYFKEFDEVVNRYIGEKRRFYFNSCYSASSFQIFINSAECVNLTIIGVTSLREIFKNKNFYLYGNQELSVYYLNVLKMLGFEAFEVQDFSDHLKGKCIEDLLYEKDFLVLLVGSKIEKLIEKVEILGLREVEDYVSIGHPYIYYHFSRRQLLDLNLGYTYMFGSQYPGIKVLGKDRPDDYKIAILGGSTTDAELSYVTSWADFLYSKAEAYHVTVFNGGVRGYTSAMELIKLLRDILNLHPDLIIVYDGVNDAVHNLEKKPYEFDYLKQVFSGIYRWRLIIAICAEHGRFATFTYSCECAAPGGLYIWQLLNARYIEAGMSKGEGNDPLIYAGQPEGRDAFESWVNNLEIMHAVSNSKGIRFFGFLQPMLASKKRKSLREQSLLLAMSLDREEDAANAQKNFRVFMEEKKIAQTHDYIYDLSDIFDEQDVYMDYCHVYAEGNQIIADEIWKVIKPCIVQQ